MTEWGVVTVIVALVGLITAVAAPMIRLNGTLTRLMTQMESFVTGLDEFKVRYKEQLRDLNATDRKLGDRINDHEHRITVLESTAEDEKGGH